MRANKQASETRFCATREGRGAMVGTVIVDVGLVGDAWWRRVGLCERLGKIVAPHTDACGRSGGGRGLGMFGNSH